MSYTDAELDKATSCVLSVLTNVTVSQACACNGAGVCTVGVTGLLNYNGAASFNYTVNNGLVSNIAPATLTINPVNDAPVANDIIPANLTEDIQSVITLSYSDVDGAGSATSCVLSSLSSVTETQGCACAAGVCTVGVTGAANYSGAASFDYVVSDGLNSNVATASLTDQPRERCAGGFKYHACGV